MIEYVCVCLQLNVPVYVNMWKKFMVVASECTMPRGANATNAKRYWHIYIFLAIRTIPSIHMTYEDDEQEPKTRAKKSTPG